VYIGNANIIITYVPLMQNVHCNPALFGTERRVGPRSESWFQLLLISIILAVSKHTLLSYADVCY